MFSIVRPDRGDITRPVRLGLWHQPKIDMADLPFPILLRWRTSPSPHMSPSSSAAAPCSSFKTTLLLRIVEGLATGYLPQFLLRFCPSSFQTSPSSRQTITPEK